MMLVDLVQLHEGLYMGRVFVLSPLISLHVVNEMSMLTSFFFINFICCLLYSDSNNELNEMQSLNMPDWPSSHPLTVRLSGAHDLCYLC